MPQVLETDGLSFEFPDEFTLDQIQEFYTNRVPGIREGLKKGAVSDLASRFPRDVALGGAGVLMGLARGWTQLKDYGEVSDIRQMGALAALSAPVGEESAAIEAANAEADRKAKELEATREQRLASNPLYKYGEQSQRNAQEFYQTNPTRDSSIPAMLSQGVASLPPMIASGVAGPLAPALAALTYGAMAGQQGAEEAIAMGQPEKADEAFLAFAGLGALSEAALGYPVAFLRKVRLARQTGVQPSTFGSAVKNWFSSIGGRITREGLEGFGRESLQEGTEQLGQNVTASDVVGYDPNRPALQGVPQAAAIGGVVGAGVGGVGGAAMAIDESRRRADIPALLRTPEAQPVQSQFIPATPEQRAAEAAGLPIPLTPPPPPGPTAEQLMAEEVAAATSARPVAPYFAEDQPQVPLPEPRLPAPRRRSPAPGPESERPRFRPPLPTPAAPVTVPPSEASAGLTALPVGEETGPTTRSGPPPARAEEGARETGIPSTPTVNESLTVQPEAQQARVAAPSAEEENKAWDIAQHSGRYEPAVKARSGTVFVGENHEDAARYLELAGERPTRGNGFVNQAGEFMSLLDVARAEANRPPDAPKEPRQYRVAPNGALIAPTLQPQETPNASTISRPESLPPSQQTQAGQEVVAEIRDAERPAVPQTETKKTERQLAPSVQPNSPLQRDWSKLKSENPDHLLAVRLGDFYEFFNADAESVAKTARVALTKRKDVPMAGIPFHAAESYFKALTDAGLKVAIVDVLEGGNERRVTEVREPAPQTETPKAQGTVKQGAIGQMLGSGESVLTSSGRQTTPFPKVSTETNRKASATLKKVDAWLRDNAIAEAESRSDTFNAPIFRNSNPKALTQSEKDSFEEYLFGEQPRVLPKILKPLRPSAKYSVTLSEPTGQPAVTPADIEAAFPASQGFAVETKQDRETGHPVFLVRLPNRSLILINPTLETIAFDAKKAAEDWGIDPALAEDGRLRPAGVTFGIEGLSNARFIDLLNTAGPDTLSHEKFHALFDMALTGEERASILNRYKTEEKAAEAFRRSEGFTRSFWEKIRRFIEWLANLVRGDAFKKLRAPLSAAPSQPSGRTEPQYSLEQDLRNRRLFEQRLAKPITSSEEAISLTRQAGAGAGLVPDAIAEEVSSLNLEDPIEKRMAPLLEFVLQLHGVAPALELQSILADPNIPEDTKQAAISNVLNQITHVRAETDNLEAKLQEANEKLASAIKQGGKITKERLVEARAKQIADNLISRYRQYLTAQAANLPANQNIAAARSELIQGMRARLDRNQTESPDSMWKAIERIAERISELPVSEGPIAVTEAIRQKGILRDVAGDPTIDLLTAEKPGGLAPLLASPEAGAMLQELADLQKKAETYAKQIEVIEQAFRGKDKLTPVELRQFADAYRKFRNKQSDAAKAIREYDKDLQKADDDAQVYGRSHDLLTRLQESPEFKAQFNTVLARPGGEILRDIYQTGDKRKDDLTKETVFLSPLTQKPYRVHLSPTRQADNDTLRDMDALKADIDEFLKGENVDPLDRQTWEIRRAYIEQYQLHPQYLQEDAGGSWSNPFQWGRVLFGGLTSSLRAELESIGIRASQEADTQVRVAEQAAIGLKLLANNKEFGDAATVVATIAAVKSHNWPTSRILHWNQYVLNPILASGQTAGQMRLKAGDYIPGTNTKITPQDIAVARMEKRFSSGIAQTTQGTGKGLPAILRHNPVLIADTALGKPVLRGALSPGPLTMARSFSRWGRQFDVAWAKATTPEAQRRLVNDGENFQMAALGYVRTTNPEFKNDSPLVNVYEQYAKNSKDNNQYSANSFDQLVDHLADIAVAQQRYQTKEEATPKIEEILMADIGQHVAAIRAQFAEDKINPQVHQTVMQYASAQNAFTKARKRMVAPDPYYDYTLTHESDRISFVGAGFQQFQLRIVASLEALQTALGLQQTQWDAEISDLYSRGGTEAEARAKVNKKTVKQIGDVRFSYEQLLDYKRRLDKLIKQLKELVIDVRDPNDSLLLQAVTRFQQTLSSGLLASPTAIGNNLAGGIMSAKQVTLRNLGQAQSFWDPKAHGRMAGAAVKSLLRIFPGTTAIGKLARSNIPVVEDLSGWVHDMLLEQIKQEAAAESFGLRTTTDLRNRSRARGELMTTAGQIEYDKPGAVASAVNVVGSLPVVRQALAQLRDKIPGAFDRWMNTNNANFYKDTLFENLKVRAIRAFAAREQIAARTGVDISRLNDFTREENLLTPKELEMPRFSGYRDSGRLRQLFSTVGSLDKFLLDYYNRWKAAPANERASVPLFPDEADMGAVLHEIESHENLATAGFTPLSMQGVGQRGLIKKVLFMFRNYPTRMFTQMARLLATDPRDPKGWREAYGWWSVLVVLIISALAGMIGKEVASPIQQAITGRSPSYVKLSNVMANPDAGMVARYVGMALGSNLPYYGGVISQILGNPGYGTWLDAAEYIPAAGLVKDAGVAVRRIAQTGEAILPGADFVGRWFPPASAGLRLFPSVAGDIERRNVERALRVVGPSAGMELAGGGGGNAVQTPASAAVRRLLSAAYRGDREGIQAAFDAAVREKAEAGSADPERAVLQSLASAVPARRVYGKSITPAEEAQLQGLMSRAQRTDYSNAQDAFDLINQTIGSKVSLTTSPSVRTTTRGPASRRALFTDSASPIFATRRSRSRRRRLGGRGRSAFRRLQIRGSSRRRRRSPARVSFSA